MAGGGGREVRGKGGARDSEGQARSQGGGVQGVLENPPFYEPPFLDNTKPPHSYYKSCNKPQLSEYSRAGRTRIVR